MKATPKVEFLVEVMNPSEEVEQVIVYILNMHPGRKLEVLQQIDQRIGDLLLSLQTKIEPEAKATEPVEK